MRRLSAAIALVLALAVGACAKPPTALEIATADYGPYPSDYQDIIKRYMGNLLFDPYSAVYENWRGPSQGYTGGNFVQTAFGYRVCVDINAKNRLGGYVGRKPHFFMIRYGAVVQELGEFSTRQLCNF